MASRPVLYGPWYLSMNEYEYELPIGNISHMNFLDMNVITKITLLLLAD